jgi:hypothetical protein
MRIADKYTDVDLRREINTMLDALALRHEPWRPLWIAEQICACHRAALASDANEVDRAFWEFAGYTLTRKITTSCVNERFVDAGDDGQPTPSQLTLPGFERVHLQDYYVVTRDEGDVAVCVLDLTDDEIIARAALFRSQSGKLLAHANELVRFIEWRRHV